MDFLSLFDPSDGNTKQSNKKKHKEQDNVKKKTEGAKGRRRGRKSSGKHETLPEESSFLCEPDLSTDILVKDVSYIEHFIEINKKDDDTKSEEKKPKRRKSRRRKKNSPVKDNETDSKNNLNNKSFKPKPDTNIGKNVNDLKKEFDESKFDGGLSKFDIDTSKFDSHASKDSSLSKIDSGKSKYDNGKIGKSKFDGKSGKFDGKSGKFDSKKGVYRDSSVYNVIDKLEKVSLKDDMYLAGDFNTEDLESDFLYCSDDEEEFIDDSTSEGSDSAEEVYGSLPPEPRFGNVEYKLRLSSLCEKRFQHLVTQLKWRLISGGGSCVYVVGVRDCGALAGLRARALRSSLCALRRMARALPAAVTHVTARRVAPHRAVAEVIIKKIADPQQSVELRIAVMGANEAGKSTLIGVLTQGELDNGTGSARLNMFRHQHEVKTGRTSSLSHEILGFDAQGNVVNYGCSSLMTAERIGARSAKLVAFLDLAGHSKYQRTTRLGLTGYSPHYAMLTISATAGITPITEEHMGLLLALKLPFFVVINKCELNATAVKLLVARLESMLASHDKKPLLITDENLARNCCAPQKLILDSIDKDNNNQNEVSNDEAGTVPVFPVSCVRGCGLAALHAYLLALQPPPQHHGTPPDQETCEFQIDEIFHVGDSSGPVVGGLLTRGQLYEGDKLLIGPLDDGSFRPVSVRSVYRNRVPHGAARAGQPASLSLHTPCPQVRPGMVLLAIPDGYKQGRRPTWGGCTSRCKTKQEISEMIKLKQSPVIKNKDRKHKKHKNLLQDLAKVENELIKDIENDNCNIFKENYIQDKKTETNYIESEPEINDVKLYKEKEINYVENETKSINYKKSETNYIDNEPDINDLKLYKKNETNYAENEPIFKENEPKGINKYKKTETNYIESKPEIKDLRIYKKNETYYVENEPKVITYKKSETNHKESAPVYTKNVINNLTYKKNEPNYIEKENESKDMYKDKIPQDISDEENHDKKNDNDDCICDDKILLEDPTDPRGCIFFQATVHVLRHSTAISSGFQCTVHVGNVRQTAIIEGIMSRDNVVRAGGSASALFRFVRCPEYLVRGRQLLFTAGLGTRILAAPRGFIRGIKSSLYVNPDLRLFTYRASSQSVQ